MSKVKIIDKKSERSIKYERVLLSKLNHPFIVNMYYAFQDYDNLYLVMDLLNGGDLRYHICRHRKFSEEQTRFFIANIILGLEYIHSKNVIHRDIKPENLVMDEKGYLRITDFGIAKIYNAKNSHETSGTPGYMSPEVMKGQNHTKVVDYFALGVIGYECMMERRPYVGKSRKEIKEQMMSVQAQIKNEDIPNGWSSEGVDFINKLLIRKPEKRLGYKSIDELKNSQWLKFYPWKELEEKSLSSPFLPEKKDNYDKKYCIGGDKIGLETHQRYEQYKNNENYSKIFYNFTYYPMLDDTIEHDNFDLETYINNKESFISNDNNSNINNKKNILTNNDANLNNNNSNNKSNNNNSIINNINNQNMRINYNKRVQSANIKININESKIVKEKPKLPLKHRKMISEYMKDKKSTKENLTKVNKQKITPSKTNGNNNINNTKKIFSQPKKNPRHPTSNSKEKNKQIPSSCNTPSNKTILKPNVLTPSSNLQFNYGNLLNKNINISTNIKDNIAMTNILKHLRDSSNNKKEKLKTPSKSNNNNISNINNNINNSNFNSNDNNNGQKKPSLHRSNSHYTNLLLKSKETNNQTLNSHRNKIFLSQYGIAGVTIKRVNKNSSLPKKLSQKNNTSKLTETPSLKKNPSTNSMIIRNKGTNNSHNSTGSSSTLTNNTNKNKTIIH